MSGPVTTTAMPPRLTMDEYAHWVSQPRSTARARLADRQKHLEECILSRFEDHEAHEEDLTTKNTKNTKGE
jgi:hypothetical protein